MRGMCLEERPLACLSVCLSFITLKSHIMPSLLLSEFREFQTTGALLHHTPVPIPHFVGPTNELGKGKRSIECSYRENPTSRGP